MAMSTTFALPPGVALAVIAFLLSLLPAGFFIWLWYLRKRDRSVPAWSMALSFLAGLALVVPSFQLEDWAAQLWRIISPATAHYFGGAILPLQGMIDIILPAIGTFAVVATVEEGLRYLLMRIWFTYSSLVDQVFDGLLVGLAIGLGFATLENAIYFLGLFRQGSYDTLVFVFFLRFMISTLAHVSFAGLMGTLLVRGLFDIYNSRRYYLAAFAIPWFLHGLYDLLLGINFGVYAVLALGPPILIFYYWTGRRDFFIIHRQNGKLLATQPRSPQTEQARAAQSILQGISTPWNKQAPWLNQSLAYRRILDILSHDKS
jgi:protease PrsW